MCLRQIKGAPPVLNRVWRGPQISPEHASAESLELSQSTNHRPIAEQVTSFDVLRSEQKRAATATVVPAFCCLQPLLGRQLQVPKICAYPFSPPRTHPIQPKALHPHPKLTFNPPRFPGVGCKAEAVLGRTRSFSRVTQGKQVKKTSWGWKNIALAAGVPLVFGF